MEWNEVLPTGFMNKMVLSILVDNTAGVLSRVSGLFSRRGYNIQSLTVAETEKNEISRMTVVVNGDNQILGQIRNQLQKLEDVVEIKELHYAESICRELMLIRVKAGQDKRQNIVTVAEIFKAKIVDVTCSSLMMELTGNQNKIDAFINMLKDYEILEMVRTGITGLPRAGSIADSHE